MDEITSIQLKKRKNCSEENCGPEKKQLKIEEAVRNTGPSQVILNRLIMNFVIDSLQPFSICDGTSSSGAAFNALLKGLQPNCKIFCTKTLKEKLSLTLEITKQNIIAEMGSVSYVGTTADCWPSGKR